MYRWKPLGTHETIKYQNILEKGVDGKIQIIDSNHANYVENKNKKILLVDD